MLGNIRKTSNIILKHGHVLVTNIIYTINRAHTNYLNTVRITFVAIYITEGHHNP